MKVVLMHLDKIYSTDIYTHVNPKYRPVHSHTNDKLYNLHASGGYEKSNNTQTQAIIKGWQKSSSSPDSVFSGVVQSSLLDMNLVVDSAEGPTPPPPSYFFPFTHTQQSPR